MKFVRWLGAFDKRSESISESASWELSQTERQVAAEPLWHGKSFLKNAKIGLVIAHPDVTFSRGWLSDSYTVTNEAGINMATRCRDMEFKNMDKFLKRHNSGNSPMGHAEAAFNCPLYSAVAVKKDASPWAKNKAKRLAEHLSLPIMVVL